MTNVVDMKEFLRQREADLVQGNPDAYIDATADYYQGLGDRVLEAYKAIPQSLRSLHHASNWYKQAVVFYAEKEGLPNFIMSTRASQLNGTAKRPYDHTRISFSISDEEYTLTDALDNANQDAHKLFGEYLAAWDLTEYYPLSVVLAMLYRWDSMGYSVLQWNIGLIGSDDSRFMTTLAKGKERIDIKVNTDILIADLIFTA